MGENPKMPYPQCGRSIKTYSQTTMVPPQYHKVWVSSTATRPNSCIARTALSAPPFGCSYARKRLLGAVDATLHPTD